MTKPRISSCSRQKTFPVTTSWIFFLLNDHRTTAAWRKIQTGRKIVIGNRIKWTYIINGEVQLPARDVLLSRLLTTLQLWDKFCPRSNGVVCFFSSPFTKLVTAKLFLECVEGDSTFSVSCCLCAVHCRSVSRDWYHSLCYTHEHPLPSEQTVVWSQKCKHAFDKE